jgi:hypothetical protein
VIEKAINPNQLDVSIDGATNSARITAGVMFPPKLFHIYEIDDMKPSCE